jgi:hypothetical protein
MRPLALGALAVGGALLLVVVMGAFLWVLGALNHARLITSANRINRWEAP